jgi:membrane protein implicated in regulation of membrane protease activity
MGVAIWAFMKSKALDKMSLRTNVTGRVDEIDELKIKVGDTGTTLSRLAPMGKIKINGTVVEAKTDNEFLDPNTEVIVKEVYKTNVLVEKVTTP